MRLKFSFKQTPIVLAFLVVLSYGLILPFMGYFMDDWYLIWYKHLFGAINFPAYFSVDRPLMGYFYVVANFLLGNTESALLWQIFGLFTRWLCVFALWKFLNTLWPNAKRQNSLVAMLAAVFPGFVQQWIAIIYSFFFFCLACFFFSLTLMLKAVRTPKRFWPYLILSITLGFYSYAAAEFYFGLELIRPVVLYIEYSKSNPLIKTRIRKTLQYWIPFLLIFLVYAIWRVFFFESVNHGVMITGQLSQGLVSMLNGLFTKIYQAAIDGGVNAWTNPLNLSNYPTRGVIPLFILGLVVVSFVCISFWFVRTVKTMGVEDETLEKLWPREAFWLAVFSLVVAVIPFWAADLPVDYLYPYDRFLLAYLLGSCLLLVVFLDGKKTGWYLLIFLIAIATGYQLNTSIRFKNSWQQQSDFFWQLTWRAPSLKENTILITDDLPFSKYFSGTSLMAPLNMIYAPELESHTIPYLILLNTYQDDIVSNFVREGKIKFDFRSFEFKGDENEILLINKPADGCLKVVLPTDSPLGIAKKENLEFWESMIYLSNADRIIIDSGTNAVPPERFFGKENTNQWCYFFEKAELARQQQQWTEIIRYYNEADELGFKPNLNSEWIPLVDAYLKLEQFDKALEITKMIDQKSEIRNNIGLCGVWEYYKISERNRKQVSGALIWLNCNMYFN